jgi:glycosyltransferase involved in cell wall biosynthesis
MKILSVCTNFRVFGAEVITLKMLDGFKQKGHEQLAVTSIWAADGEFSRRLAVLGIPELQLPLGTITKRLAPRQMWWMTNTLVRLPFAWARWARLLGNFQPDVVVFNSSRLSLLLSPWLDRYPSLLIEHGCLQPSRANRWLYEFLSDKVMGFVVPSYFMRSHLERLGVPSGKIRVVYHGPFTEGEEHTILDRSALSSALGPVRIGIAGQISPHKGHDTLLEAARILKTQGVPFVINVFGSGQAEYVESLNRKISANGLSEAWHWRGYERELSKMYGVMDICVMPSACDESFGLVALEASAYGLPVIASRRGGLPEVIQDGMTGYLTAPGCAQELADKIEHLIRNANLARKMGAAGRKRALEQFTQANMIRALESCLPRTRTVAPDVARLS